MSAPNQRESFRRARLELAAWLVLGAIVFLGFLGGSRIAKSFEERVAETAATMAHAGWPWAATPVEIPRVELGKRDGGSHLVKAKGEATIAVNPWLVPVFHGEVRLQKPPLPYWCAATFDRLLGESSLAARLVPATLGAVSGALVYLFARRVGGRRVAMIAVAVWTSSHFVVDEHRKAMADPFLAAFSLAAIVAWIEAASRPHRAGRWIVAFYSAIAMGAMAKGPVVFLHVGVAALAFSWSYRRWPRASWVAHVVGVVLFAMIALPWPIYVIERVPGAIEIWRFESIGEFADNQRNARPAWFYLPQLLLIAAPWTALAAAGIVVNARRWRRRRAFALIWSAALVAIFSASHMKKNAYLLPLMPAATLLVAAAINRVVALARRRPLDARWWMLGHAIVGVAFAVVTIVACSKNALPLTTSIAIGVVVIAAATAPLVMSLRSRDADRWWRAQAIAFALILAAFIDFPQAARQDRRSGRADPDEVATSAQP